MGLTITKHEWRFTAMRLNAITLCECGQPATHQVWFRQFNAQNRAIVNMLPICDSCLKLMKEEDSGIIKVR